MEMKNPSVLMMATILATHLSVYPTFHTNMMNREFVAYVMSLLEPGTSEQLKDWTAVMRAQKSEVAPAGESLLFLQRVMSNTGIVTQLAVLLMNNLSCSPELGKIMGSLPVKYGAKPLAKLFLIDRNK